MMLNAPYPADIRVKKETDALLKAGFEVSLLCLRRKNEKCKEVFEGISITRIDAGKNKIELAFWDVLMSIRFIHPKFLNVLKGMISTENPFAIHIHDLPLAGTAIKIRNSFPEIKVVVDFHENYPEALRTWFSWKKNPIVRLKNFLFMNPARWTMLENIACTQADEVIAVVEEMKERLASQYQISLSKITVVTNTEDKRFVNQPIDHSVYQNFSSKFILTYSGGIGPHRGVDTAIEGMNLLKENKNIVLAIVGFGSPSVMNKLKARVLELKLDNVYFLGYQPFSKFYSYMAQADVNLIPHRANGHTNNTVPHKLFQGMMTGKPLLTSSCTPLKRIVEQYKAGLVFEADNPESFASRVSELYSNKMMREELGRNGKAATMEGDLNWETSQLSLLNLYEKISQ